MIYINNVLLTVGLIMFFLQWESGLWSLDFGFWLVYYSSCKFGDDWLDDYQFVHATTCRLLISAPMQQLFTNGMKRYDIDVSWLTDFLIGGVAINYGLWFFLSGSKKKDKNVSKISRVYLSSSFSLQNSPDCCVLLGLHSQTVFW